MIIRTPTPNITKGYFTQYYVLTYNDGYQKVDKHTFDLYARSFGVVFLSKEGYECNLDEIGRIVKIYAQDGRLIGYRN